MSTLPQELIDRIIDLVAKTTDGDEVDEGSSPDLIACSLVSKSFRCRCTKHLFSSTYIDLSYLCQFDAQKDSPLQRYTTIAQYIEHLTLSVAPHLENPIQKILPSVTEILSLLRSFTLTGPRLENPIQKILPSITEILSPLKSFTLIGLIGLNWEPVAIALDKRRQVSNPLLSSQLTTLSLKNVSNVPPTLFSICVNLTAITFTNVELQSSSHTQGTQSEAETGKLSRPRLLELHLAVFSKKNLLDRLFPPRAPPLVDVNGLRNLTIVPGTDYKYEDIVAVWELMAISKDTLHRLSWHHWTFIIPEPIEFGGPLSPVDLSLFPALRMFEIPLMAHGDDCFVSTCILRIVLNAIFKLPTTLDMLTITIYLGNDEVFDHYEETEDEDGSEEPEDDTSYVARIPLDYSGLRWRKVVNAILRTSRSISGTSEFNPIALHILFDFLYPRPNDHFSQEQKKTHRIDWKKSISALVKKEFYKLKRGGDTFKFEYISRERPSCQ